MKDLMNEDNKVELVDWLFYGIAIPVLLVLIAVLGGYGD